MTIASIGNRFAGKMSITGFRFGTMDENEKPASWLDDLSELIKRKKEENEPLKKLRESLDLPEPEHGKESDAGENIEDDTVSR